MIGDANKLHAAKKFGMLHNVAKCFPVEFEIDRGNCEVNTYC